MARCSQNQAAKRQRTDPPTVSLRHARSQRQGHEFQDDGATDNALDAAEEQHGAPIDEAEEHFDGAEPNALLDEAEQEQLRVEAGTPAGEGVVLRYKVNQEHNALVRRLSELAVVNFTPEQRDEMALLKLSIKHNWTQDGFNDILEWSKKRRSNSKLRNFKSLTTELVAGYPDESISGEVQVANRLSSIRENSDEEEETDRLGPEMITRSIVCNDILAVSLELFDRLKPELQRYEEGPILQSMNQGDWWKETELHHCYEGGILIPDKFLFPIITFTDGVLAANGGKLSVGAILVSLGLFSVEELSKDGCREYVGALEKGNISEAEKQNRSDVDLDIFHRSLEVIFRPIRECAELGGFEYAVNGAIVTLVPVMPFIVQDTDEGNRLCGVFNSWGVQQPCHICEVSQEDCDNPNC